jgi:16S rRNA (cytidine1402-2'-O)-methyltransferase
LIDECRTIVLYEAPHRLARTLVDLAATFGADRRLAVARELTKLHEEVWRGTVAEAIERLDAVPPRGEYVLVIAGATPADVEPTDAAIEAALAEQLAAGKDRRTAIADAAKATGVPKRRVYDLAHRPQTRTD